MKSGCVVAFCVLAASSTACADLPPIKLDDCKRVVLDSGRLACYDSVTGYNGKPAAVSRDREFDVGRGVKVTDWRWRTNAQGDVIIEGRLKNDGKATFKLGQISVSISSDGSYLGSGKTFIDNKSFAPGDVSTFDVYVDGAANGTKSIDAEFQFLG